MDFSKELEDLFSELNANPYLRLSPAKIGQPGNVKSKEDWLDNNCSVLVFRNSFMGDLDPSGLDVFVTNTKALLDKHLGHCNWIEDAGENPKGTAEAWSRHSLDSNQLWTQVGLCVTVGENCRPALI